MRKFFGYITFATALILTLMLALFAVNLSATELYVPNYVVFVDGNGSGTGDGSSPENALKPVPHKDYDANVENPRKYLNSALYQAAELLADTGGTIVVSGKVTVTRDYLCGAGVEFVLPKSERICVTSKYDGVDYRETNGAILQTAGCFIQKSEVIWEYIDIEMLSGEAYRNFACNGYRTVFGEGINCTTQTNSSDSSYLPSICGSARYGNSNGDTDIIIKSGSWHCIAGSVFDISFNNRNYVYTGNVNITFDGGSAAYITGSSRTDSGNVRNKGNVNITVNGGTVGAIHGSSKGGFIEQPNDYEVNITINGGAFTKTDPILKSTASTLYTSTDTCKYYYASSYKLNVSNASSVDETQLDNIVKSAKRGGYDVVYPASWITGNVNVTTTPNASAVFKNDVIQTKGAKLSVSYSHTNLDVDLTGVEIDSDIYPEAFSVECDTSKTGVQTANFKYGDIIYYTTEVNVLDCPEVDIRGIQLRATADDKQQKMRFISNYTDALAEGVTITDFGVIVMESKYLSDDSKLNFEETRGMIKLSANEDDVVQTGNTVHYSCVFDSIKQNMFNRYYTARAYVELSYNGKMYYRYSDTIQRNPYVVAKSVVEGDRESVSVKNNLKANVIDAYDNYDVYTQYESDEVINKMREDIVAYMRAQATIEWTPKETFLMYNAESPTVYSVFVKGLKYYGVPYTNDVGANNEYFSSFINENGEFVFESITPYKSSVSTAVDPRYFINSLSDEMKSIAQTNYDIFPGSDCSGAVIYSWNQVINNRIDVESLRWTEFMLPHEKNATIPVGSYVYDYDTCGKMSANVVAANGTDVMYSSYSELKPGDAIVKYSASGGHTRLVISVDAANQTMVCLDQSSYRVGGVDGATEPSFSTDSGNTSIRECEYSFRTLYDDGYLPITIPELTTGHSDKEFTYVTSLDLDADLPNGKLTGVIGSNRQIISAVVEYKDESGNVVYSDEKYLLNEGNDHLSKYDLSKLDMSGLSLTSGEKYTFSLNVRVAGKIGGSNTELVTDYEFVKR